MEKFILSINHEYLEQWFQVSYEQLQDRILQGTSDDAVIIMNQLFQNWLVVDKGLITFDHEERGWILGKRVVVEEHSTSLWRVVE